MTEAKKSIAQCLRDGEFVLAPGIFDMISARMADSIGFKAIYMTGYGIAASYLGRPDAGYATFTDMVSRASQVVERTATPLIADADTGFGGPLNVQHTVRGYEKAGVQAIQIEDQQFPKKCGHSLGRLVVPLEDMATKIKVAVGARESEDFLIIARTDSRTTLGLDEALRRGEAFANAGADVIFIESPETVEEMKIICANFDKPCFANMVEGGRTPLLSAKDLEEVGFAIGIFPGTGFLATAKALKDAYGALKADGISNAVSERLFPFEDMHLLMGFEEVWEFDKIYGDQGNPDQECNPD